MLHGSIAIDSAMGVVTMSSQVVYTTRATQKYSESREGVKESAMGGGEILGCRYYY